jgi:acyl-CoA reductase-like NAD-dependent aldehyde dehydrogenase
LRFVAVTVVHGAGSIGGEADADRAVEAARAALDGLWGKTSPNERARLLHALPFNPFGL